MGGPNKCEERNTNCRTIPPPQQMPIKKQMGQLAQRHVLDEKGEGCASTTTQLQAFARLSNKHRACVSA